MLTALLRPFAYLPLWLLHGLGSALGWLVFLASPRYRERMRENLLGSGVCADARACQPILTRSVAAAGKSALELLAIWLRPQTHILKLVPECHGWEHVEAAQREGRGVICITPHMGCFEIASRYIGAFCPITVLYRPPRLKWLEPLMLAGRMQGQVKLASTDLKGVRALLAALKRGEAIGILPDQVPGAGEGVWANFFGRPAYTMTLVGRLQQATGAAVLLVFGERLPRGQGYRLRFEPLLPLPQDREQAAAQINTAIEQLVRQRPEQYLWSYNRYKVPRGTTKATEQ